MHRKALFRTNRNKHLALYIGERLLGYQGLR